MQYFYLLLFFFFSLLLFSLFFSFFFQDYVDNAYITVAILIRNSRDAYRLRQEKLALAFVWAIVYIFMFRYILSCLPLLYLPHLLPLSTLSSPSPPSSLTSPSSRLCFSYPLMASDPLMLVIPPVFFHLFGLLSTFCISSLLPLYYVHLSERSLRHFEGTFDQFVSVLDCPNFRYERKERREMRGIRERRERKDCLKRGEETNG